MYDGETSLIQSSIEFPANTELQSFERNSSKVTNETKIIKVNNQKQKILHHRHSSPFTIAMHERRMNNGFLARTHSERGEHKEGVMSSSKSNKITQLASEYIDVDRKTPKVVVDMHNYSSSLKNDNIREFKENKAGNSRCDFVQPVVNHSLQDQNGFCTSQSKAPLHIPTLIHEQHHDSAVTPTIFADNFTSEFHEELPLSATYHSYSPRTSVTSTLSMSNAVPGIPMEVGRHSSNPILVQNYMNNVDGITSRRTCLRSFEVAVAMPSENTIKEVMDVLSNPDLLRIWYEPVNALTVINRKGVSLPSPNALSYSHRSNDNIGMYRSPCLEENNDCDEGDGDLIIRSASEEMASKDKQREQYDGEWVEASTTTLTSPYSHTSLLSRSLETSKTLMGFPTCGNIRMFIERNEARVVLSIGPFEGGTVLSHTITVSKTHEKVDGYSIMVIDYVKIVDIDEETRRCCSGTIGLCFGSIQWSVPSIDGYIEQTEKSLENLRNLVQRRHTIFSLENSILVCDEQDPALTQPLLSS